MVKVPTMNRRKPKSKSAPSGSNLGRLWLSSTPATMLSSSQAINMISASARQGFSDIIKVLYPFSAEPYCDKLRLGHDELFQLHCHSGRLEFREDHLRNIGREFFDKLPF